MKKLFLFLCVPVLLFCAAAAAQAQERIIDFASAMHVNEDGSAVIEEVITVNAENIKIRRGLYRDIPNFDEEPVQFISLYMDNEPHPSFTEDIGENLRINFGDDDYIAKGRHTYKLTYSIEKVVKDFQDYDEVYWNVTGNDWEFPIEHASFRILLPHGANIKRDLVSTYTGRKGSKSSNAVKSGDDFFETTETLSSREGFTVAVPFEKGIVQSYKKSAAGSFFALSRKSIIYIAAGAVLFIFFVIYFIITWFAVGKDPNDVFVTEFTPPDGMSPAFMRSLWRRGNDKKMFATALVSLAMKDKIEISEEKVVFQKTAILKLKDKNTDGLPEEEKYIINTLFSSGGKFEISQSNWSKLSKCMNYIEKGFDIERKKYIISNKKYIVPAAIALILFQLLFIPLGSAAPVFIFINFHYSIFLLVFVCLVKNKIFKLIAFIALNLFYSLFFFAVGHNAGLAAAAIEIFFLLSFWGLLLYVNIIDNLTAEGRALFNRIKGFRRYMTIAEEHRVEMSVPVDDEKIFADFLPYAFAFDMENKWMKRFEQTLSQATIERYTNNIGGRSAFGGFGGGLLVSAINAAAPRDSGSSGSGSGGGGGGR